MMSEYEVPAYLEDKLPGIKTDLEKLGHNISVYKAMQALVQYISSMRPLCNEVEWRLLQAYMPIHIYSLYVQQVLKSNL